MRWIPDDESAPEPDLNAYQTVTGGEWPVYKELPKEPETVGVADAGDEVRVYGEKDGYVAVKTADGLKGYIRKEAFERASEAETSG